MVYLQLFTILALAVAARMIILKCKLADDKGPN